MSKDQKISQGADLFPMDSAYRNAPPFNGMTVWEYLRLCCHVSGYDMNKTKSYRTDSMLGWEPVSENLNWYPPLGWGSDLFDLIQHTQYTIVWVFTIFGVFSSVEMGYPIKLYINRTEKKAILAFSCTQADFNQYREDHNIFHKLAPRICSDYFEKLNNAVQGVLLERGINLSDLTITGFSLGASLAEMFAIKCQYPAVTFDGTGCKDSLIAWLGKEMALKLIERSKGRIISFLSAPSCINTLQEHVTEIYKLIIGSEHPFPNTNFLSTVTEGGKWGIGMDTWTSYQHSLASFASILKSDDFFQEEKCIKMKDWPTRLSILMGMSDSKQTQLDSEPRPNKRQRLSSDSVSSHSALSSQGLFSPTSSPMPNGLSKVKIGQSPKVDLSTQSIWFSPK